MWRQQLWRRLLRSGHGRTGFHGRWNVDCCFPPFAIGGAERPEVLERRAALDGMQYQSLGRGVAYRRRGIDQLRLRGQAAIRLQDQLDLNRFVDPLRLGPAGSNRLGQYFSWPAGGGSLCGQRTGAKGRKTQHNKCKEVDVQAAPGFASGRRFLAAFQRCGHGPPGSEPSAHDGYVPVSRSW